MARGDVAPFDGQLLSTDLAISIGQRANACNDRMAAEVTKSVRLVQIDLELCEKRREIDADKHRARMAILGRRIDELEAWHRDPLFVAIVSVALTVTAIVGARYTVIDIR